MNPTSINHRWKTCHLLLSPRVSTRLGFVNKPLGTVQQSASLFIINNRGGPQLLCSDDQMIIISTPAANMRSGICINVFITYRTHADSSTSRHRVLEPLLDELCWIYQAHFGIYESQAYYRAPCHWMGYLANEASRPIIIEGFRCLPIIQQAI
jgi:hypothetical protein